LLQAKQKLLEEEKKGGKRRRLALSAEDEKALAIAITMLEE
jgi:hypothetical protein